MTTFAQATGLGFGGAGRALGAAVPSARRRGTVEPMADAAPTSDAGLEAEEARLARAAARGDGEAFATLYERYARRAYNLALRLSGSAEDAADAVQDAFLNVMKRLPEMDDRELAFGSYLFTATRNATYDLIRRQQRSRPSDSISESAVPIGAGAGGLGLDPGDPDDDPDRKVLLEAQQEEIAEANARLPERQREALALRELEEMSYDEIAEVMGMNRNSVAQLISRARIGLRDELRGTALASVASASPECERALPLIAARDDGQLEPDSTDAAWLASHMSSCSTCQVANEAMQEAGVSYRAWVPAAIAPWLFEEAMARASELTGGDWTEVTTRRLQRPTDSTRIPGLPAAYRTAAGADRPTPRRRRAALVALLAVLLLLGGGAIALSAGGGEETAPRPARSEVTDAPVAEPVTEAAPAPEPAAAEAKKPKPKPQPTAAQAPAPEPLPVTEAAAPAGEPPAETKTKAKPDPGSNQNPSSSKGGVDDPDPVRVPQPDPAAETVPPPPPPPPPAGEEPVPPRPPQPPVPGGPGGLVTPPGPPKPG